MGDGAVGYAVAANTTGSARFGSLTIAGRSFTVEQPCVDPLAGGGFEDGTPSAAWSEASVVFDSPLCNAERCGFTGARSGAWWAWLGGSYGAAEEGSLEQLVVVPEDAVLEFYLFIGGASGNGVDELRVRVDGVELFSVGEGSLAYDAGYERVQVNLGGFARSKVPPTS